MTLKIFVYSPLFNLMAWIWSKQACFKILFRKTSTENWLSPTAGCQMNHWYMGNVWTWWQWCDLLPPAFLHNQNVSIEWEICQLVLVCAVSRLKTTTTDSQISDVFIGSGVRWCHGDFFFPVKKLTAVNCLLQPMWPNTASLKVCVVRFMRMMAVCENVQTRCEQF